MRGALLCLLILVACSVTTICNAPYMNFEQSCCLDQDNNSICDRDDVQLEEENESSQPTLLSSATVFQEVLDNESFEQLYTFMLPSLQEYISSEDFAAFYPSIRYGKYRIFTGGGDIAGEGVNNKPWTGLVVADVVENESEGVVTLSLTNITGGEIGKTNYSFFFDEAWYVDAFKDVVYASCTDDSQCNRTEVEKSCRATCMEENKHAPLREDRPFMCRDLLCHCVCYHADQEISYVIKPNLE